MSEWTPEELANLQASPLRRTRLCQARSAPKAPLRHDPGHNHKASRAIPIQLFWTN